MRQEVHLQQPHEEFPEQPRAEMGTGAGPPAPLGSQEPWSLETANNSSAPQVPDGASRRRCSLGAKRQDVPWKLLQLCGKTRAHPTPRTFS